MVNTALFTSNKEYWETPQAFFENINNQYHFTFDLAASKDNAKCRNYYTEEDDSLSKSWHEIPGNLFLNPPYGRSLRNWVQKAYEESLLKSDGHIVLLIPSRTDTSYWHDFIFNKAEIKFLRGRLRFELGGGIQGCRTFPFCPRRLLIGD